MPRLGVCFPREFPAAQVVPVARALDRIGDLDLWLIEDCFYTTGIALAAASLAGTERITVGLGILPAVARNPAITAMEIATLAGLAPGRVVAGIGHGLQVWMEQIGARTPSPLTTLREVLDAVRPLLRGESVTTSGSQVRLTDVRLEMPPDPVPPVLAGVVGPKSLALAGRHADGLVLADWPVPEYVRQSRERAAAPGRFEVAVFATCCVDADRSVARRRIAPHLVEAVSRRPLTLRALPFFDDLAALVADRGADGLLGAPDDWWTRLGAIGTPDDAAAHVAALTQAGTDRIGLFLPPDAATWQGQVDLLGRELLAAAH